MADDILNVLLVEGKVIKIAEDMYTLTEYMEEAKNIIREKLAEESGDYDCSGTRYICDQPKECETNFGIYGQYQSYQESWSGK